MTTPHDDGPEPVPTDSATEMRAGAVGFSKSTPKIRSFPEIDYYALHFSKSTLKMALILHQTKEGIKQIPPLGATVKIRHSREQLDGI